MSYWIAKCQGLTIMNIMAFYEREQGIISLENVNPSWLVFCDGFAQGDLRSLEKRFFDVFASLITAWCCLAIYVVNGISDFSGKRV